MHDRPATVLGFELRTNLVDWEELHYFLLTALASAKTAAPLRG
jgi:hypothetical protein